jgi:hypothetical protein
MPTKCNIQLLPCQALFAGRCAKRRKSLGAQKAEKAKPRSSRKTLCLFRELLIEAEAEESTTTTAEETPQQQKLQQQTQKQKIQQKGQSVARTNRAPF